MRKPSRRGFLAGSSVVLASLAGCLNSTGLGDESTRTTTTRSSTSDGDDGGDGTDASGDAADVGTRHDVDGRDVRLESARTSRAIVTLLAGVHPSVSAEPDRQYVVVELSISGDDARNAAVDACELRLDDGDRAFEALTEIVQPFTEPVHLAFELPLDVDPTTATLAWVGDESTVTWQLPRSVPVSLESPPQFEVRSFDVPERADGDEVEVSFVVANVGEGDGTFLAELGTRALSDQPEIRVPLKAGESRTVTDVVGLVPSVGDQPVVLDWGSDSLERTVSVPTTTETSSGGDDATTSDGSDGTTTSDGAGGTTSDGPGGTTTADGPGGGGATTTE